MLFADGDFMTLIERFGAVVVAVATAITLLMKQSAARKEATQARKEIAEKIDVNTRETVEGKKLVVDKVESATKDVKDNAKNVAIIATRAVSEAKSAAESTATTTHQALAEIKNTVNGTFSEQLAVAHRAGYALGQQDRIVAQVDDHAHRLLTLETRIDHVDKTVVEILEYVRPKNGNGPIRENG